MISFETERRLAAYWAFAALLCAGLAWATYGWALFASSLDHDYWEHAAAITAWQIDLWSPGNPHLVSDAGSPRYMPYLLVLTVLARVFGLDAHAALALGGVANAVLLAIGIRLFFRTYFRSDRAPLIGAVVLIAGWGAAYLWANLYQLRSLLHTLPYPATFVFALSLVALWLAVRALREPEAGRLQLWLALVLTVGFVSHPLTGAFAMGAVGLLALTEPGVGADRRFMTVAAVLAAAMLAEIWPYFSTWTLTLGLDPGAAHVSLDIGAGGGMARAAELYRDHPFYDPLQVLTTAGPALLGLPVLVYLIARRRQLFIVLGFGFVMLPYVLNLFVPVILGHRFLIFGIFFLHLALVWTLLPGGGLVPADGAPADGAEGSTRVRGAVRLAATAVLLPLLLAWNVGLAVLETAGLHLGPRLELSRHETDADGIASLMRRLGRRLPGDAVVMANPRISWPMPSFFGKVVALHHPNPMVADQVRRLADVAAFFAAATPAAERTDILRRYGVSHVVYRPREAPGAVQAYLAAIGENLGSVDGYRMVEVAASR